MGNIVKPFCGLLASSATAQEIASPPYDVLNRKEALAIVKNKPHSFLRITRGEVDFDDSVSETDERVYAHSAKMLTSYMESGFLVEDTKPSIYPYQISNEETTITGVIAHFSLEAYRSGRIAKHELTKPDKEKDRALHLDTLRAQPSPVLLTVPSSDDFSVFIRKAVSKPVHVEVVDGHGFFHRIWKVSTAVLIDEFVVLIEANSMLYIADGHHRSAAANVVSQIGSAGNSDYLLAGLFPASELTILEYNRGILPSIGLGSSEILEKLSSTLTLTPCPKPTKVESGSVAVCVSGDWYMISFAPYSGSRVEARLDVSKLTEQILTPIFGIEDMRRDKRVEFIGGNSTDKIEQRVISGELVAGFVLHPTPIEDLISVSKAGKTMPPKSTWFHPKLLDGLVSSRYF